jgi:hypothetical protein
MNIHDYYNESSIASQKLLKRQEKQRKVNSKHEKWAVVSILVGDHPST